MEEIEEIEEFEEFEELEESQHFDSLEPGVSIILGETEYEGWPFYVVSLYKDDPTDRHIIVRRWETPKERWTRLGQIGDCPPHEKGKVILSEKIVAVPEHFLNAGCTVVPRHQFHLLPSDVFSSDFFFDEDCPAGYIPYQFDEDDCVNSL